MRGVGLFVVRVSAGGLTLAVAPWFSHAADHDLPVAEAVGGVRVGQAALPEQIHGLHHLRSKHTTNQQEERQT